MVPSMVTITHDLCPYSGTQGSPPDQAEVFQGPWGIWYDKGYSIFLTLLKLLKAFELRAKAIQVFSGKSGF